jgi:hypothetical protein
MPISALGDYTEQHWVDVRLLVTEALSDTDFAVQLVSDASEVGVIQKRIVQNLYVSDLVICDVSGKNPNVMFELGMRLAFDKPTIIIKDTETAYSFDTSPIEHLTYPSDLHYHAIQTFKAKLREKALATYEASLRSEYTTFLKHFGEFVVPRIEAKPVSKEDFILKEIAEARSEIRELARVTRIDHRRESTLFTVSTPSPMKRLSEVDFVKSYLESGASTVKELRHFGSEAFEKLLDEYLTAAGMQSAALTAGSREGIGRLLLGAVNAAA